MSDQHVAKGILSNADLLEPFLLEGRAQKLRKVAADRTRTLTVVLDHLHHQHNISAVMRSAEAFGLQNVHIIGEELLPVTPITMGCDRWLDIIHHDTVEAAYAHLQKAGYRLALLEAQTSTSRSTNRECLPVTELPFREPLALIFGNEREGITSFLRERAHYSAYIPMVGFVESLNVSVAAAITLFCSLLDHPRLARQVPLLDQAAQRALLDRWFEEDVRGAAQILSRINGEAR